jgi:hypothetical protein
MIKFWAVIKFLFFIYVGYLCSNPVFSQHRYDHLKRVKIEKKDLDRPAEVNLQVCINAPVVINQQFDLAPQKSLKSIAIIEQKQPVERSFSTPFKKTVSPKKSFSFESILGLKHAKNVSAVQMEKWMLAMILLYSLGLILLILCIVFVLTLSVPYLTILISILGGICIVAASIILPLGLAGVI